MGVILRCQVATHNK